MVLVVGLAAAPLAAQQPARAGRTCQMFVDSVGGLANFVTLPGGSQNIFAGGGILAHCVNEPSTRMVSDSIAYFQDRNELQMMGRVHFEDSTATLDADRVTYWTRQERLEARGNVFTRNRRSGSELRGPYLDYLRAVPGVRDTLETIAVQRPTIHFRSMRDSARADREPFVVVADRVRTRHTDRMWASGRVTIDRTDLSARADSAMLNLGDSLGYLIGAPEVVGRDTAAPADSGTYRLTGQRIRFALTGDQEIRRAVSAGRALATGPDWRLRGDTLDILLDSGQVQRAQAWGLMDEEQPSARSGLNLVLGDSLDIQMPGQVMRLIWSYGRARADSRADSTSAEPDWLAGDTLRAAFVPADSGARRASAIDHVDARGGARAYYHVENTREPACRRGITYSRGARIRIAMAGQRVRTVDVAGETDGVYLEPLPCAVRDSAAADTARVRERNR